MSTSRRTFLRAAGVSIGLPLLESLLPRAARAQPIPGTKRFVALFFPNGSTMRQDWQLTGSGTAYGLGTAHAALVPHRARFSIFKNLDGPYSGSPDHARGTASFLTGAPISNNTTPQVDLSVDQLIANTLNPPTRLRSLHLGPTPYPSGPPSDTGWPSGYNTFLSWRSPTSPNPPLESAQVAFNQVFVPSGTDPNLAARRYALKKSIIDHTVGQLATLRPRLGSEDTKKLDEYLTSVRDVESRLQAPAPASACGAATGPGATPDFASHTRAMLDIIVLALRCDATRVVTYSMDYGFGNKDFSFLGVGNGRHHNLSHSGSAQAVLDNHKGIVRWYMDQLAYFIGAMQAVDEGGGVSLLDNSVCFAGSDVGDGWSHSHRDLCALIAGGGAGALRPGRLIDAAGASYDSVLLALAQAMGANAPTFSGATVPFAGL